MCKMLATDYDRTFYISDEDIEVNKEYVKKFRNLNNVFVIATGRSYYDFNKKRIKYEIKYDYVILNHGATIIDKDDNILLNISIDNEIIPSIKKDLLEKSIDWFCCSRLESRVDFEHKNLTKINVKYTTKEDSIKMAKAINDKYGEYVKAYVINSNSIEIASCKINKASAIYEIMKLNNIKKENIYTIGDGYSDIEMVKEFNGYCMNNSINELKEVSIDEFDSVSKLIKKII